MLLLLVEVVEVVIVAIDVAPLTTVVMVPAFVFVAPTRVVVVAAVVAEVGG